MNRTPRTTNLLAGILMALGLSGTAFAQAKSDAPPADAKPCEYASYPTAIQRNECYERNRIVKTYFLGNATQQNDANEILIALRNVLDPDSKLYLINSDNAIVVGAPPDQQSIAQKLIAELDVPKKLYRLTFTLADSESGKRVGIQHFSIVVADGQRTTMKQGDKIPVVTGTYDNKSDTGTQTQFQYLDVGLAFDATLAGSPGGLLLKSKVEETHLGQPSTIAGVQEPVVRQITIESTSKLTPGKPLTLGSLDIEGTTRHIDIEVVAEPIS